MLQLLNDDAQLLHVPQPQNAVAQLQIYVCDVLPQLQHEPQLQVSTSQLQRELPFSNSLRVLQLPSEDALIQIHEEVSLLQLVSQI